ncbi:hypothetical protein FQN53_000014 [Emmonsiellopsis sp. PD_33]|nr:hypothetical protein FQN53_000014 [Emmonsiellopsis sp. PD_33]
MDTRIPKTRPVNAKCPVRDIELARMERAVYEWFEGFGVQYDNDYDDYDEDDDDEDDDDDDDEDDDDYDYEDEDEDDEEDDEGL